MKEKILDILKNLEEGKINSERALDLVMSSIDNEMENLFFYQLNILQGIQ